jgi:hypothetical protein
MDDNEVRVVVRRSLPLSRTSGHVAGRLWPGQASPSGRPTAEAEAGVAWPPGRRCGSLLSLAVAVGSRSNPTLSSQAAPRRRVGEVRAGCRAASPPTAQTRAPKRQPDARDMRRAGLGPVPCRGDGRPVGKADVRRPALVVSSACGRGSPTRASPKIRGRSGRGPENLADRLR